MGEFRRGARLLVWGVLAPAAIITTEYWLLRPAASFLGGYACALAIFFLLAAQLAAWNWLVARSIGPGPLRWILFGWGAALASLFVARLDGLCTTILAGSLISASLGLLMAWAMLGAARWPWRLPGVAVVTVFVCYLISLANTASPNGWWPALWIPALVVECLAVATVGLLMRRVGLVIGRPCQEAGDVRTSPPQFALRDFFLWSLALVPILVILPRLETGPNADLGQFSATRSVAIGLGHAALVVTALWAILSRRSRLLRNFGTIAVTMAVGLGMRAILTPWATRLRQWPESQHSEMWLAWAALMALFTIALSLALAWSDYRLLPQGRCKQPKPS